MLRVRVTPGTPVTSLWSVWGSSGLLLALKHTPPLTKCLGGGGSQSQRGAPASLPQRAPYLQPRLLLISPRLQDAGAGAEET